MPNPGKTIFCYPLAAMESALAASQLAAAGYLGLLHRRHTVVVNPAERRQPPKANPKPFARRTGARLEDRYGRRNHDVDVERL